MKNNLIEVENLKQYFPGGVRAVDGVSFSIKRGETLGLVGESGCGKTTTGRTVLQLYEPTDGKIIYNGKTIFDKEKKTAHNMKEYRKEMQMIFQDPYASLDPRMRVTDIVAEGLDIHGLISGKERKETVEKLLRRVGLGSEHADRYPHEFSGGQRQRIGIARALAVNPRFIVCDEPISALDVSIQAQIINMLVDLQNERELSYLFIAHDISVVRHISDRIGVMYLGKIVELGASDSICTQSAHPYTKCLIQSVPIADPLKAKSRKHTVLSGEMPNPMDPPKGCRFHTRCPYATAKCVEEEPIFREIETGHYVACHYA